MRDGEVALTIQVRSLMLNRKDHRKYIIANKNEDRDS